MTRRRLLKIKHCAAPQFEIIQHFTCIISFTVFLIVTAVKQKVGEEDRCFIWGQIHCIYKTGGGNYNFNQCALVSQS